MNTKSSLYEYAIETGIPIAPRNERGSKYPFASMDIGQSFSFPAADIERVRQCAYTFARQHKPMKFSVSAVQLRCWRVA